MNTYQCREKTGIKIISAVKEDLLSLLDSGDSLTVDLSSMKRIDLSFAQILIAAHREAVIRNIPFKIAGICTSVRKQLILCGAIHTQGNIL